MAAPFTIIPEVARHRAQIETLLDRAFGLGRRTKTSYRLREREQPVAGLSFVALEPGERIVGAISFWRLAIGDEGTQALLLGPLAVDPERQGIGVGRALMKTGLERARTMGHRLVILVGDEPYYGRVGFRQVPENQLTLPGPVDPERLLYLELDPGSLAGTTGLVLSPHRFGQRRRAVPTSAALAEPCEAGKA